MSVADQRGPHFDTPTGTLNFYDNGQEIAQQNVHPVEGSTFQVISDGGGPHDLVAVYSGDKQFVGDTARVSTSVNRAATDVAVTSNPQPRYRNGLGDLHRFRGHPGPRSVADQCDVLLRGWRSVR